MTERLYPWQHALWQRLWRMRQQRRLAHALLFVGPRGVGKAHFVRELSAALLCEQPDHDGFACKRCRTCRLYWAGNHPEYHWIDVEEGSQWIRIDAIRQMQEHDGLSIATGQRRIFVLHRAERMNLAAANALLKLLEEPRPGSLLILLSTHQERLPVTVRSRCQLLAMPVPETTQALAWLQAQCPEQADLETMLYLASGAPLQALELLEHQSLGRVQVLWRDFVALSLGQASALQLAEKWLEHHELEELLRYLLLWLHAMIRARVAGGRENIVSGLQSRLERLDLKQLYFMLDALFEAHQQLEYNINAQMCLETLLMQWVQLIRGE